MSDIAIHLNPTCGTLRNVLSMIRNSGAEPVFVAYLKTRLSRARPGELIRAMGTQVSDLLRRNGTPQDDLKLVKPVGARLCRPSETVLELLPKPQRGAFTNEDGEAVVDAEGRRVVR
jgi:arsenate reductase